MNNAARSRRFESCTHAAHVGNVAGNNANSLQIARLHDRIEPPRIFAAIKDDGRVATPSQCFDNPGADAALRSGDEISFCHLLSSLQNRERTGVPKRAARLGWWLRPDPFVG